MNRNVFFFYYKVSQNVSERTRTDIQTLNTLKTKKIKNPNCTPNLCIESGRQKRAVKVWGCGKDRVVVA